MKKVTGFVELRATMRLLVLYIGDGPFPGVIDMFGTAGGLIEMRSALLASRGFVAFALPYFDYEDLPSSLELNWEYFEVSGNTPKT